MRVPGGDNIDTGRLFLADSNLRALCEGGPTWTCISAKVAVQYPDLPDAFQRARDIEHHVAEGESWDQQLLNISKLAFMNSKVGATGAKIN